MIVTDKACSALQPIGTDGGRWCKHGHHTTAACYGSGYPSGECTPLCLRDDHEFDDKTKTVGLRKWAGDLPEVTHER